MTAAGDRSFRSLVPLSKFRHFLHPRENVKCTTFLNVLRQSIFVIQKSHKRENSYFFPSVICNDVHAFFLLKNSTAPPGTPIPPLNDKKARKKKYKW